MLVVFSPIFVADTKIIFRYDFVTPLKRLAVMRVNKTLMCTDFALYTMCDEYKFQ